jgi:hypothetical protein
VLELTKSIDPEIVTIVGGVNLYSYMKRASLFRTMLLMTTSFIQKKMGNLIYTEIEKMSTEMQKIYDAMTSGTKT